MFVFSLIFILFTTFKLCHLEVALIPPFFDLLHRVLGSINSPHHPLSIDLIVGQFLGAGGVGG